jgi:phosphatidylglycerol:prolipoprotein diacylglycerol transferase
MHPVLLQIGSFKIYSYGTLVAVGFLVALWVCARETDRLGIDRDTFYDLGIWLILAAVVGSRLFHVLVYWRDYAANPLEIFKLWNGGLVFYGGLLGALLAGGIFLRRKGLPFLPIADVAAIGIPLGIGFGRLGCTLAGCCYGKPTGCPLSITFTNPASLAPLNVPLHPTQPYEALAGFCIALLLYLTRDRFRTPGMRFWTMLILYGIARSSLEILRDDPRGFVGPFSESQVVSFVLILYAVGSMIHARARAGKGGDASPEGPGGP